MKKTLKLIALIGALALMATSAAACNMLPINLQNSGEASQTASSVVEESSKESSEESSQESSEESSEIQESSEQESSVLESQVESSIEESSSAKLSDYLTPQVLDNYGKSYSNDTVTMKAEIQNDTQLVFTATLKEQLDVTDAMKETLEKTIDNGGFPSIIQSIEKSASIKDVTIVVKYYNADNSLILEKEYTSESSTESEASDTSVQESSTAAAAPSGVYSSLTEMYNDPSMKSTFDKTAESFSNDMMDVKILIENNTQFVYDFKYKVDTSSISADYLKNALNSASSTYDGIADQLKSLTNDKSVSVIVRYVGNNGNTIAEKEYFGS